MNRRIAGLTFLAVAVPAAGAQAATLSTDAKCYIPGQPVTIAGAGWGPGTTFAVNGQGITATGIADAAGNWTTEATAPSSTGIGIKPVTVRLTASQDAADVADATFQIVNFLVKPASLNGRPTGTTKWSFGGFLPGRRIYFHIKRGNQVYRLKVGKPKGACGTLKKTLPRLPGVPAAAIRDGKYKVFVDQRKKFKQGGRQYTATITIT